MSELRRADYCCVAMAEIYRGDGEILANPTVGTIPFVGARLARATFEPDLVLTDGEAMLVGDVIPIGQPLDGHVVEGWMPYRQSFDVVWSGCRHVVMGASQLDRYGNQNISCIGPWDQPKAQLIGARGAPGNTVNHATSYWVPSHSTRVFVPAVDFVSGVGPKRAREWGGVIARLNDIRAVVTDLGVFDFGSEDSSMRVRTLHPGVDADELREKTGFPIDVPDDVEATRAPTEQELQVIAMLDPQELRYREMASS
jgi:acyl CoA:acetate/3-ketoacid CoA transferase beta subunit